jgi:predicted unusual protein kinase regulating ubiquinone biosynthesis (AarF/ABC1/UbiB family)
MDYIQGRKITQLSPVARTELDTADLARQLFDAYLEQIIVDGLVHADPHPGNVLLTEDRRIALIDLGTVIRISAAMQDRLLQLVLAMSEGRGEEVAELSIAIGVQQPHFDDAQVRRRITELVAQTRDAKLGQIQVGRAILVIARVSGEGGLRVPPELTMLGKTLLHLDEIVRVLDPAFDLHAAVRRRAATLTRDKFLRSLSPGNVMQTAFEMKEFVQRLPQRVNRILDLVASNSLEVKVDALDEAQLMEGFQKVANRIATGLVLAALIVGAALMMQIETSFRIMGYPGLAILSFLAAAGGGVMLVVSILLHDRRARRKRAKR